MKTSIQNPQCSYVKILWQNLHLVFVMENTHETQQPQDSAVMMLVHVPRNCQINNAEKEKILKLDEIVSMMESMKWNENFMNMATDKKDKMKKQWYLKSGKEDERKKKSTDGWENKTMKPAHVLIPHNNKNK